MISEESYENFLSFLEQSKINGNVKDIRDNKQTVKAKMPCFYFPDMYTYSIALQVGDGFGGRICFDMYRYEDGAIYLYMNGSLVGYFMKYPTWLKW